MALYTINQKFQAAPRLPHGPPSDHMIQVAEMFGIGLDESYEVTLYEDLTLDVRAGDVVFVTGPSGSGKSTGSVPGRWRTASGGWPTRTA